MYSPKGKNHQVRRILLQNYKILITSVSNYKLFFSFLMSSLMVG